MVSPDPRPELRATLAGFDERRKKIVGALVALMIQTPERVRDREWLAEQLTHVTLYAGGFDDVASVDEGVQRVQAFLRENAAELLEASYRLFGVTAEDLEPRLAEGLTKEQALAHALDYLGGAQA